MIDLGVVKPGSKIRIPFTSFDKDDGSAITMTNFAVGDILIYKDGGTTERASTSGYAATTDFDAKTGKHIVEIDLADNTTAGFFNAGSEYLVAIDSVTIDTVTTGGWIARFSIGYRASIIDTTIATLSSQTSFTLTDGPAEDDAIKDHWAIIHDIASKVQLARVLISAYTGSTKTVTLAAGATFTVAAGDNISIMEPMPMQPATIGRKPVVDTAGLVDANTVKVGPTGSGTAQTAGDIPARLPAALTANGNMKASMVEILTTALTETSGLLAGGFKKFFNVASPTLTCLGVDQTGDGYARLGAPAGASVSADVAAIKTDTGNLVTRITSTLFSGITSLAQWLGMIAGKQTGNSTARTEIRATGAGSGTFDETTDSAEAIRDNMGTAQTGDSYARIGATGSGLTSLAPAATALSTAQWSSARAGYLDNLNVGGNVASSSEVTAIQNNTRAVFSVPEALERPDSGTTSHEVHLYLYDEIGNMEAPDSAPTLTLTNPAGTDRSARLDSTTMALVNTGHYKVIYTNTSADTIEQLLWEVSIVEGGATRKLGRQTQIVDTTAVDFSSTDRTKLQAVYDKLPSKTYLAGSNNSDGDVQMDEATGNFPGSVASVVGAVGSVTGNVGGNLVGSIGSLGATAKADVNAEVDSALDTAIPGLPTANSVNERLKTMDDAYTATRAALLDNLDAAVTTRATPAQVRTQVDAALDATSAELSAVPAATSSIRDRIAYMFAWRRNKKTQTASTMKLRNDADSADIAASTVSDDGTTLTIGEDA